MIVYRRNAAAFRVILVTALLVALIAASAALNEGLYGLRLLAMGGSLLMVPVAVICTFSRERAEPERVFSPEEQAEDVLADAARKVAASRRPLLTGTDGEPL